MPQVPSRDGNGRGVTDFFMQVVAITPDFARGLIRFVLLETGYRRVGVIAPDAQVDYGSATTAQRDQYFFICDDADNEMSNGDDGYGFI